MKNNSNIKNYTIAGVLIGIGMVGFFDGIFMHQILQIHNMLSNKYFPDTLVNEQINMFWDGLFHAFTWLVTGIGIFMLWKVARQREVELNGRFFIGSIALGGGAFNFIEGIIDHHILEVHHVMQRAAGTEQLMWDLAFLASGLILMGVGVWLRRTSGVLATENTKASINKLRPSQV